MIIMKSPTFTWDDFKVEIFFSPTKQGAKHNNCLFPIFYSSTNSTLIPYSLFPIFMLPDTKSVLNFSTSIALLGFVLLFLL